MKDSRLEDIKIVVMSKLGQSYKTSLIFGNWKLIDERERDIKYLLVDTGFVVDFLIVSNINLIRIFERVSKFRFEMMR